MKKINSSILGYITLLLFSIVSNLHTQTSISNDNIIAIIKDRVDRGHRSVGMVVGIIDDNGTRVVSYGKTIKNGNKLVNGDSIFEIGSLSKLFTATLLADMIEKGEVKLDAPVSKYLPEGIKASVRNGKEITLENLACQNSGLPMMPNNLSSKDKDRPYDDYSNDQLFSYFSNFTPTQDFGEKYGYSNVGVALLGQALAKRAGTDYESLLQNRLCKSLGMTHTRTILNKEMKGKLVHGHNGELKPIPGWNMKALAPAGGIRSSVNDLLIFLKANMGKEKTPLSDAMEFSQKPRHPGMPPDNQIGLIWNIYGKESDEVYWHDGQTSGFAAAFGFSRKNGIGVVILSNASYLLDDIAGYIIGGAQPSPPDPELIKKHHARELDQKFADEIAGQYATPNQLITITHENGKLYGQAPGKKKYECFQETETGYETGFFLKDVDAQLNFVKDSDGKVHFFNLHQNNYDLRLDRIK